jgi:hypothetical protein
MAAIRSAQIRLKGGEWDLVGQACLPQAGFRAYVATCNPTGQRLKP